MDVDWNFLLFLRQRYDNHVDLPEVRFIFIDIILPLQASKARLNLALLYSSPELYLSIVMCVLQSVDPKLPEGWRVKNINGVEYFKIVVNIRA